MKSILELACGFALAVFWMSGQIAFSQEQGLDLEHLRNARNTAEANADLEPDLQLRITELYDQAIESLESAEDDRNAAATFEMDRENIRRTVEALREILARPDPPVALDPDVAVTAESAQSALTRERSRLAAYRAALQVAMQRSEERTKLRTDIARQLGELDQQLEELSNDIRMLGEKELPDELAEAALVALRARRQATVTAIERLRQTLTLLEERGALIPLDVEIAQRKVISSEERVALLEKVSNEFRQRFAAESLQRVFKLADAMAAETPELTDVAAETKAMALKLWGDGGVVDRSEDTVRSVLKTRKHLADVNRIVELTRRKFEAFGHRGSIARWWPDVPDDMPGIDSVNQVIRSLDQEIPEAQHQLITAEEARARHPGVTRKLLRELEAKQDREGAETDLRNARELFPVRRDLLDRVILEYGRYSNQLVELRTLSTHFRDKMEGVEAFLYSHLLWSRSVPRPIVPRAEDITEAMGWLVSPEVRREIAGESSGGGFSIGRGDAIALVALVLAIVFRRRIKKRLAVISERVADPSTDAFRYTVEAVVWTVVLALPVPLILFLSGGALYRSGAGLALHSTAKALRVISGITLLLEGTRQLFAPNGLAETHFRWPTKVTKSFFRGLIFPEIIALPLLFVAVDLAFAGMRLNSPDRLQAYNNSLGRLAFVLGLLVLGLSILALLRPERADEEAARHLPWSQRWSQYAFPTAFLIAYPVILLATVVPAVLAAFGYYITGLLLAYQMERTMLLFMAVLIAGGLLYRWWRCRQRSAIRGSDESLSDATIVAEYDSVQRQMHGLFRFSIILAIAIGLYSIWSEAFPLLEIMKRVQLLPRVQIVEVTDAERLELLNAGVITETRVPAETASAENTPNQVDPTSPLPGSSAEIEPAPAAVESEPLTLWAVLEAILAALITLVLVRNLPSLFDLFLKRRTNLDSGARFAFATLLRYSVTIVGLIVVFGVLGVTWSKVQWLAAALTFGLGFGLQEIVANFVSGLILLVERPVRVGDMVTVGNLMGRVTRIQIRATTITLLDRSEMIVPNKEFITTMLVNWTLSDSKRRIEIPIRIAYGEDLERVKSMVTEIASGHPDVLGEPPAHTLLIGFGDDAVQLELRFVVDFGKGLQVKDEVQMAIDKAFQAAGIEFALPQRTIHVVSQLPDDDRPPVENPEMD